MPIPGGRQIAAAPPGKARITPVAPKDDGKDGKKKDKKGKKKNQVTVQVPMPQAPPPQPSRIRMRPLTAIPPTQADRQQASKAMFDELESLRRYLRRGRDITKWRPAALPPEIVAGVGRELEHTED
jgi:hypothetical protein